MLGSEIRFPLQQQRENRIGSPFVVDADMPGACPRDLKAPLSGAGGVNNGSRPSLALCASVSPVFRSREARVAKERRIARFSFLFFGGGNGIRRPRPQGAPFRGRGVSTTNRGRHSRYVRVPFSASEKREESCDSSLFVLSVWYRGLCRFRVSDADSGKV